MHTFYQLEKKYAFSPLYSLSIIFFPQPGIWPYFCYLAISLFGYKLVFLFPMISAISIVQSLFPPGAFDSRIYIKCQIRWRFEIMRHTNSAEINFIKDI